MHRQTCVLLSATEFHVFKNSKARNRNKRVIELKYIGKVLEVRFFYFIILHIFQETDHVL